MVKYVCNAQSGQMLNYLTKFRLDGIAITEDFFREMTRDAVSYMGHKDLAEKFDLPYNRENLYLKDGDVLYVAQYESGRTKEEEKGLDNENRPLIFFQIYVEEK